MNDILSSIFAKLHDTADFAEADFSNIFSMSVGDTPFSSARLAGHDNICDLLAPLMKQAQSENQTIWVRARIAQLRREIAELEKKLNR